MTLASPLRVALRTEIGKVRAGNEDAVAMDLERGLLILADGMGGHNAGEIASGMAVSTVVDFIRREGDALDHGADGTTAVSSAGSLLRRAVESANRAIFQAAQAQAEYDGMGTTIVALLLREDRMSVAHVGDSRLYRFRGGALAQITRDHSLVEELVARGQHSRADATARLPRNVVTRALGVGADVEVDLTEDALEPGDVLLMCSDGLTDLVGDGRIARCLNDRDGDVDAAADALIRMALDRGGTDNVSVVLVQVLGPVRAQGA